MAKKKRKPALAGVIQKAKIKCSGNKCTISPPNTDIWKANRDQVKWTAVNTGATIWFPTGEPFGWTTKSVKSGASVSSGVPIQTGTFEYAVHCEGCARFAEGNSNPQVIVH